MEHADGGAPSPCRSPALWAIKHETKLIARSPGGLSFYHNFLFFIPVKRVLGQIFSSHPRVHENAGCASRYFRGIFTVKMTISLLQRNSLDSKMKKIDLTTSIGKWDLKNPVLTASGTFGYGQEFADYIDLNTLGAIVVKGISLLPRPGNPPPRVVETSCGMLNAIGLENVGIEEFIKEKLAVLSQYDTDVVVNILGDTINDYCELCTRLDQVEGIKAIEVNISCPNVKRGGVAFGTDAGMAHRLCSEIRKMTGKPLILKLSPNVTDISLIARAVEDGGADAVSLINTLLGMAIDIKTKKPRLANIVGGLSGPAIKPVALRMVWQTANAVKIPVIGIGGISSAEDALEFLLAGASAIQVGTANFINPAVSGEIIRGIKNYLLEQGLEAVSDLVGSLQM